MLKAQGSALYALVSDYEANPDTNLRARIENFILVLEKLAAKEEGYCYEANIVLLVLRMISGTS